MAETGTNQGPFSVVFCNCHDCATKGPSQGGADGLWWVTKDGQMYAAKGTPGWTQDEAMTVADRLNATTEAEAAIERMVAKMGPNLGMATTAELLAELQARAEVGGYAEYRTVDNG